MQSPRFARFRRPLLSLLILGSVAVSSLAGPVHSSAATHLHDANPAGSSTPPPAGTELWHIDTPNSRFVAAGGGQTHLYLYAGPVGQSDEAGWHFRDPSLLPNPSNGSLSPAQLPFSLRIGAGSSAEQVATLQSEDGVTLGLGVPGFHYSGSAGIVQGNAVMLAPDAGASAGVSAALRATVGGVAASFTLSGPTAPTTLALTLVPDARAHLDTIGAGIFQVTRPVTLYADDDSPIVEQSPEYLIERATAVDAHEASVLTGAPATESLATEGGLERLTVSIDPTWLHDAQRSFPVRVDVPILSMFAAQRMAASGTTTNCDPAGLAPRPDLLVGQVGGCQARSVLKFDLSALGPGVPVLAATLRLWSPDSSVATGAAVLGNVAPAGLGGLETRSWQVPTWSSAPQPAVAHAIPESGTDGNWHLWDVTTLVRQWLSDHRANGGLSLVSSQGLARFASSLGSGLTDPTHVPYLDVLLPAMPQPFNSDGTNSIYGISGGFGTCSSVSCSGAISVFQTASLNAGFARVADVINCGDISFPNQQVGGAQVTPVLQQANTYGLVPIISFQAAGDGCGNNTSQFVSAVSNFAANLHSYYPTNKPVYFEIGNEPNANYGLYGGSASGYATEFSNAAKAIVNKLGTGSNIHITTGGASVPYDGMAGCTNNLSDMTNAINAAHNNGVPYSNLAMGVHPYSYFTGDSGYWRNFGQFGPTLTSCVHLDSMISAWLNANPNITLVFSEDNWSAAPNNATWCLNHSNGSLNNCEGTFLVDVMTWLADHNSYAYPFGNTRIRLAWFTGVDFSGTPLGLYDGSGNNKTITFNMTCPNNSSINGSNHPMAGDYQNLAFGGNCY